MTIEEKYILSAYKEISLLSESATKKIHIVKDEVSNRLFIKKVLPGSDNLDFYRRLASLEHINLVKVHDVFHDDDSTYIIEEYISGQTLKSLLESGGVQSEGKAADYAVQVCNALAYLHNQTPPIIHRDIKPENIMLSADGVIKLIDFDIAREYKKASNRDTVFMGTKEYAAPEQYGYKQTDNRTDIYAIGVLLHELITGRLPENNITYNGSLRKIILKCLQLDPAQRYQSILALKQALVSTRLIRHKKKAILAAVISVIIGIMITCVPMLSRYMDTRSNDTQATEWWGVDNLYDLLVRINHLEEPPDTLLKYEPIDTAIREITGDFYDDVVNALQVYDEYLNVRYDNPNAEHFAVPAYNTDKDEYLVHDSLLLELGRDYISVTYYDKDLETIFYFTTLYDKENLTTESYEWVTYHFGDDVNHPIVFDKPKL